MLKKVLALLLSACISQSLQAQFKKVPAENSVYQYAVKAGSRQTYLWIPPKCKQVRGAMISFANLLERNWLEDGIIRRAAAKDNLAIILVEASPDGITPELLPGGVNNLVAILKSFAEISGYPEIAHTAMIPIDHSIHGVFTWNMARLLPQRTIAAIPVKTFELPSDAQLNGVPLCYFIGENDEWPPVKDGSLWSRDFIWPLIRQSALKLRALDDNNLVSVVTDPGGGHLDWSDKLSRFMALYIHKACQYRLPKHITATGAVVLNPIQAKKGWLVYPGGIKPDSIPAASYNNYKGDAKKAYWFFDSETAKAAVVFSGDRRAREKQMVTFVQDGKLLPLTDHGFVALNFTPGPDGMTFKLDGGFFKNIPAGSIGQGDKLNNAGGPITFRVITGPAVQVDSNLFNIRFNRSAPGGDIWLLAEQAGDANYQHTVQPAQMKLPARLTTGIAQAINFPLVNDQDISINKISLNATSTAGLKVAYYIESGPAIIKNDELLFTEIPAKSKYPIKVTIVAYQWGRMTGMQYQSALPVKQSFWILKRQ